MGGIGWRGGATLGVAAGALTTWLATPWISMAVHGTVDGRRSAWLRAQQARTEAGDRPLHLVASDAADRGRMPPAWDTIPGPRPRARGRSRSTS